MNVNLKPGEVLNHETGEITKADEKTADQILAEITGGVSAAEKMAVVATTEPGASGATIGEDLEAKRAQIAAELEALQRTDEPNGGYMLNAQQAQLFIDKSNSLGPLNVTHWQPGVFTPAHDGEYEILNPINGMIERASYDTMFEWWSCEAQYPTWRGLRAPSS